MAFNSQRRTNGRRICHRPRSRNSEGRAIIQIPTRRRKSPEKPVGRSLKQSRDQEPGLLQASSSLMERVDGTRWSWRPASICAVFLGNICFFIASLTVLVLSLTKQQSPPHQSSTSSQVSAAHLVLNLNGNTSITRGTLDWFYSDVEGAFLGPSFEYSSQKLKIKKDGLYCIYAQINVNRRGNYTHKTMNAGLYIYHNHEYSPLLTLTLHLSDRVKESYTNSKSQIYRLSSNDILYGTLMGTTEADEDWALKNTGNFFGIFQINEKETVQKGL